MNPTTPYPDLARVLTDERARTARGRRQARTLRRIARAERAVRRTEEARCRARTHLSALTA